MYSNKKYAKHCFKHEQTLNSSLFFFFSGESYKLPCPKCDKTFFIKASLKHHTRAVHEGKSSFDCTICGVRYNSHFGLRRHMNYAHENNKEIKTRNASKRHLVKGMQLFMNSFLIMQ